MNAAAADWTALASTVLTAMRYTPPATLDLLFRHGTVYRYVGVPPTVADGLRLADSKGTYFNRVIKGRFPYHRLA